MRLLLIFILLISGLVKASGQDRSNRHIYDTILARIHKEQLDAVPSITKLDQQVGQILKGIDLETGRWNKIDYADHRRINPGWLPILGGIRSMTVAYTLPGSKFYQDDAVWFAVNKSIDFFTHQDPLPYCDNWYIQGISRPQKLALSLVNMEFGHKKLVDSIKQSCIDAICKDTAINSPGRNNPLHRFNYGANKTEIAIGWIYTAALLRDKKMLAIGSKEAFAPIELTTGEGIQYDLSYDMHYGYLYNGAYGAVFLNSILKAMQYTRGTDYAVTAEKLDLFRKFILASIFGITRGQWIDWNTVGRGISRRNTLLRNYSGILSQLAKIDYPARASYEAIRLRNTGERPASYMVKPSHAVYWSTDYTVHNRPNYFFSIHAVSTRNFSQEIGNKENIKGYWGAEGTTNLQVRGDEYFNIFPLWDWAKLPGTTLPDTVPILEDKAPGSGDRRGTSSFCGGVSDSLYGATTYVINDDLGTSAKKSWFMFDEEIVCLGSSISSTLPNNVNTTLNQCVYNTGDGIYVSSRGSVEHLNTSLHRKIAHPDWLIHDSIAYLFPGDEMIELTVENRRSDWTVITANGAASNKFIENKKVFQLTIPHGTFPAQAAYSYIIVPAIKSPGDLKTYLKKNHISIVCNNADMQAVYHRELKMWQTVFFRAKQPLNTGNFKISTDIPAVVMIREKSKGNYELHIADPSQSHQQVTIMIQKNKHGKSRQVRLNLPREPYAGQSVSTRFSL